MKKILGIGLASILFGLSSGSAYAVSTAGYTEGWNDNALAGWLANTTLTNVEVSNTGGNPAGYLYSYGDVSGSFDIGALTTLAAVTGDYTVENMWEASVDIRLMEGNFDDAWLRFRYQDSRFNGWRYSLGSVLSSTDWQTLHVAFDSSWTNAEATAAGWEQELFVEYATVDWGQLMTDVYTTEVRISGEGTLSAGIDNYTLSAVPIPEPSAAICFGLGALIVGWAMRSKQS